jgi:hypothetical protein
MGVYHENKEKMGIFVLKWAGSAQWMGHTINNIVIISIDYQACYDKHKKFGYRKICFLGRILP